MKHFILGILTLALAITNTILVYLIIHQTGTWFKLPFLVELNFGQYYAIMLLLMLLLRGVYSQLATTKSESDTKYGYPIKSPEFKFLNCIIQSCTIGIGFLFIYLWFLISTYFNI